MRLKPEDDMRGREASFENHNSNLLLNQEQADRNRNPPNTFSTTTVNYQSIPWSNNLITPTLEAKINNNLGSVSPGHSNGINHNNNLNCESDQQDTAPSFLSDGECSDCMSLSSPEESLPDLDEHRKIGEACCSTNSKRAFSTASTPSSSHDASPDEEDDAANDTDSWSDGDDHNLNCRKLASFAVTTVAATAVAAVPAEAAVQAVDAAVAPVQPTVGTSPALAKPAYLHLRKDYPSVPDLHSDNNNSVAVDNNNDDNEDNNNVRDRASGEPFEKPFYDKPKLCISPEKDVDTTEIKDLNVGFDGAAEDQMADTIADTMADSTFLADKMDTSFLTDKMADTKMATSFLADKMADTKMATSFLADKMADTKMADAILSGVHDDLAVSCDKLEDAGELFLKDTVTADSNVRVQSDGSGDIVGPKEGETAVSDSAEEKFSKEQEEKEGKEEVAQLKKEKMEINNSVKQRQFSKDVPVNMQSRLSANTGRGQHRPERPSAIGSSRSKDRGNSSSYHWEEATCSNNVTPMLASPALRRREYSPATKPREHLANRKSVPAAKEKKKSFDSELLGSFDVYNIETALPKIDLEAIEAHLRASRELERRRLNDREEIRRRLAMGSDADDYYGSDRPGRKPSLQSRLQSGMNLQICFMNETASDSDSVGSDTETPLSSLLQDRGHKMEANKDTARNGPKPQPKPLMSSLKSHGHLLSKSPPALMPAKHQKMDEEEEEEELDFFGKQAKLQAEARLALAQAKEMAHMQMEIERQQRKKSPITEMVRHSLQKAGIAFPPDRRRVSRQILTEMNVAQLQIIVNDLHTQIEVLNEELVKLLLERDDLHMEQDSMLVDIEDLTRYFDHFPPFRSAKEQSAKEKGAPTVEAETPSSGSSNNGSPTPTVRRNSKMRSLVKK